VQPARVRLLFWMSERDWKRLPRRMRCLHAWHVPELPISERPLDLGWVRHLRKRVSPMHRLQLRRSARSLRAVRMQVCLDALDGPLVARGVATFRIYTRSLVQT